jgi:hypothetical protein
MFNQYNLQARIFPTIICAIPILLFQYFFLSEEISIFLVFLGKLKIAGDITISIVILYFVSQINRFFSKTFFEKEEIYMPTTDFLLISNSEYSNEYKVKIYEKLEKDFGLKLPIEKEQKKNEINSRKRISEIMSLARKKVGSGKLLLQHNIEYGFWRNLIGGTIFAVLFSGITTYFSYSESNKTLLFVSIILLIIYLLILIFNKFIIGRFGKMYARVLIQEYMGMKLE